MSLLPISRAVAPQYLHSFPTRRSSDLGPPRRTSSGRASRRPLRGRAPCAAPRKSGFPLSPARPYRGPSYRIVLQAKALQLVRIVEIAPIEDRRGLQPRADRLEIGAAELL